MQGKKARLLDLVKKTSRIAHIVFLKLSKGPIQTLPVNMKLGDLSSVLPNSKVESTKADAENIEIARKSPRLNLKNMPYLSDNGTPRMEHASREGAESKQPTQPQ